MATVEIPIEIEWGGASGSPGVHVWHFRSDGTGALGGASDTLKSLYQAVGTSHPSDLTFRAPAQVKDLTDRQNPTYTDFDPWTVAGSGGLKYLPPADCMLMSFRSASAGRKGAGRKFWSPLVQAVQQDNGTPTESARSGYLAAAQEFIITFNTQEPNGAFGSLGNDGVMRDWISVKVPNMFGVLRSRRD